MNAILCAVLAGLCWGVGEIFTKSAINSREVGPFGAVLIRAAVTLPLALLGLLAAQWLLQTEPTAWWRGMRSVTWLKLIFGSGLLAGFGGVFFFYLGLALPGGDISKLRPIAFGLAPATAVLLGWWFLGERITLFKMGAIVLIVSGIFMLAVDAGKPSSEGTAPRAEPR